MSTISPLLLLFKVRIERLSKSPKKLQEELLSSTICDKRIFLELLTATERFHILNEFELAALVTLIEDVFKQWWLLSAIIIERLKPDIRHAVAAQLSEDMRNKILEILRIWQKFGELEFIVGGEYIPDRYIMTGEWPEFFPERLRKCALCGKNYTNFDGIEIIDEDLLSSYHECRRCP